MRRRTATAFVVSCGLIISAAAMPSAAAARLRTSTTIFEPFRNDGTPTVTVQHKRGYCWTGSLAINRYDAWRCLVGNFISDPCFSSDIATGYVVCPNGLINGGIEIRLTRGLPYKYGDSGNPSTRALPWNIQTLSGRHYVILTGTTTVIDGQRANYGCVSRGCASALWGGPRRHTEPWTILWAPFNATNLNQLVKIRRAWT
jgi:hypothetical protein